MPSYDLPAVQAAAAQPASNAPRLMAVPGVTPTSTGPVRISTQPLEVDLDLYKGDDFWLDLVVTNPDGTDADLSWATPSAQIRAAPNAADIIAAFVATVDGNTIHLHLPHSEAANLVPICAWDAQIAVLYSGATYTSTWRWTTDTTAADAFGELGIVGDTWEDATQLNVNTLDIDGTDIENYLTQIQAGQSVRVEVAGDTSSAGGLSFGDYTVTAVPSTAAPAYWSIPVTVNTSDGSPPTVDGQPVTLTMPTAAVTTLAAGTVTAKGEVTMP